MREKMNEIQDLIKEWDELQDKRIKVIAAEDEVTLEAFNETRKIEYCLDQISNELIRRGCSWSYSRDAWNTERAK